MHRSVSEREPKEEEVDLSFRPLSNIIPLRRSY